MAHTTTLIPTRSLGTYKAQWKELMFKSANAEIESDNPAFEKLTRKYMQWYAVRELAKVQNAVYHENFDELERLTMKNYA